MINDLISREYVKLFVCEYEKFNGKETEIVKAVPIIAIDNAPTVNDCPNCEYKLQFDYISSSSSYKELQALRKFKTEHERPQGEYVDISKLRLMTVEECAGHTIDYAMGWKACIEWIKKGGAE